MKMVSHFNDDPFWGNREDSEPSILLDEEEDDNGLEPPEEELYDDDYWASIPDHWEGERI